ncbi:MAG: hypothetical protein ACI4FX_09975 [Agathobacter sp.]
MDDYKCEYGRFAGEPVERLFLSCFLTVKRGFGHIDEKSECTAHFALFFGMKYDALGVETNNLIFTSRQMPKMWAW